MTVSKWLAVACPTCGAPPDEICCRWPGSICMTRLRAAKEAGLECHCLSSDPADVSECPRHHPQERAAAIAARKADGRRRATDEECEAVLLMVRHEEALASAERKGRAGGLREAAKLARERMPEMTNNASARTRLVLRTTAEMLENAAAEVEKETRGK